MTNVNEVNAYFHEQLAAANGVHEKTINQTEPKNIAMAAMSFDMGASATSPQSSFCDIWKSAKETLEWAVSFPFIGKYFAPILGAWHTADKFFVHSFCDGASAETVQKKG